MGGTFWQHHGEPDKPRQTPQEGEDEAQDDQDEPQDGQDEPKMAKMRPKMAIVFTPKSLYPFGRNKI